MHGWDVVSVFAAMRQHFKFEISAVLLMILRARHVGRKPGSTRCTTCAGYADGVQRH
jgi:hypothetical protein